VPFEGHAVQSIASLNRSVRLKYVSKKYFFFMSELFFSLLKKISLKKKKLSGEKNFTARKKKVTSRKNFRDSGAEQRRPKTFFYFFF